MNPEQQLILMTIVCIIIAIVVGIVTGIKASRSHWLLSFAIALCIIAVIVGATVSWVFWNDGGDVPVDQVTSGMAIYGISGGLLASLTRVVSRFKAGR